MNPDIQYFGVSGTWVKPPAAARVDVVARGGGGGNATAGTSGAGTGSGGGGSGAGASFANLGPQAIPADYAATAPGEGFQPYGSPGTLSVSSFDAADLPDTVEVTVGKGGRPGGRDGYALIVTHLAESEGSAGVLLQGVR